MLRNASSNVEAFNSLNKELTPILKKRDASTSKTPARTPRYEKRRIHTPIKGKTPTRADWQRSRSRNHSKTPKKEHERAPSNVSHTRHRSDSDFPMKSASCTQFTGQRVQFVEDIKDTEAAEEEVVCNISIAAKVQEPTPSNLKETINSQIQTNTDKINLFITPASVG